MKLLILFLSVVCGSTAVMFIRWSTAPSLVLVVYRMAFAVLLMTPSAWRYRKDFKLLRRKPLLLCVGSGAALGLHFATFFEAVKTTSIAAAAVLVNMHVLFVALATVLVFRRRLPGRAWAAILLAFGGAVVIALADTAGAAPGNALWGDALALLSAMMFGTYTMIGSVCRKDVSTTVYTYLVYGTALLTVLLLTLFSGMPLTGHGAVNYATALGMAVFCTLLGHSIFSWSLKFFAPSFASTVQLMDSVMSAIWGLVIFSEHPGLLAVLGSAGVILGVLLYSRSLTKEA